MKTLCFASTELTTAVFRATFKKINIISSLFGFKLLPLILLLPVAQILLKTPGLKTFRNLFLQNWGFHCSGVFPDRETWELSTDPCKITGSTKLNYYAHTISPVIISVLLNVFSCRFSLCYVTSLRAKNPKSSNFNVDKNYEYLNKLQGAVFL